MNQWAYKNILQNYPFNKQPANDDNLAGIEWGLLQGSFLPPGSSELLLVQFYLALRGHEFPPPAPP